MVISDTVEDFFRDAVFGHLEDLQDVLRGLAEFKAEDFQKKYPEVTMLLIKDEPDP